MRVLVVNAGSSSLKVDLVAGGVRQQSYDGLPTEPPAVDAVGHRIVHGGRDLVEPVLIDDDVEQRLRDLVDLAPLHQPKSLERHHSIGDLEDQRATGRDRERPVSRDLARRAEHREAEHDAV